MISSEKSKLVDLVVQDIYNEYPWLMERFGEHGKEKTIEDNYHHLDHLDTAFQMNKETFFLDYTKWLQGVLTSRGVSTEIIIDNYERLIKFMDDVEFESSEEKVAYKNYLESGIDELKSPSSQ